MTCLQAVSRGNASASTRREGQAEAEVRASQRAPHSDPHSAYLEPAQ